MKEHEITWLILEKEIGVKGEMCAIKKEWDSMQYNSGDHIITLYDKERYVRISCCGEKKVVVQGEEVENHNILRQSIIKKIIKDEKTLKEAERNRKLDIIRNNWFAVEYGTVEMIDNKHCFIAVDDIVLEVDLKTVDETFDYLISIMIYIRGMQKRGVC